MMQRAPHTYSTREKVQKCEVLIGSTSINQEEEILLSEVIGKYKNYVPVQMNEDQLSKLDDIFVRNFS